MIFASSSYDYYIANLCWLCSHEFVVIDSYKYKFIII